MDDLPKLPSMVTNCIFITSLIVMMLFTWWANFFRHPDKGTLQAQKWQLYLTLISILNYGLVILFISLGSRNNYLVFGWMSGFLRPAIVILQQRDVRAFTARYTRVINISMPMVGLIVIYMMFFAWMGQVIF